MRFIRELYKSIASAFHPYGKSCGIQPFIIVFLPRTGSNYLAAKIDGHPEVMCHHEIFNPATPHRCQSARDGIVDISLGDAKSRDADVWGFLRFVFCYRGRVAGGRDNKVAAIGAKLSHYDPKLVFLSVLFNRRVKKIVLKRENILASYVSDKRAAVNGHWVSFDGTASKSRRSEKVYVEYNEFLKYERRRKVYYKLLSVFAFISRQNFYYIDYGSIGDQKSMRKLLKYIGVEDTIELMDKTSKQSKGVVTDGIENVDELRRHFSNSSRVSYLNGLRIDRS